MIDFETIRDTAALFFGLVGTLLSVFNFWDIRRRHVRRIKPTVKWSYPFWHDGEVGEAFIQVRATNTGLRDVTVTNFGLELPGRKTLALLETDQLPGAPDTRLPALLSDGEIASQYLRYRTVIQGLRQAQLGNTVKVRPFADDSSGKRHYGAKLPIDTTSETL